MLHTIAENFASKDALIRQFFKEESAGLIPPLYLSCDIRNSGKKLGVIDTNLFPAGFNNLCNAYSRRTVLAFRDYFRTFLPNARTVFLLIEEHTRNRYYLDNVHRLISFLTALELETRIVFPGQEIKDDFVELTLSDHSQLPLYRLKVENGKAVAGGKTADVVLSNNDFSQGLPDFLLPIQNSIFPSPQLGWHRRKKSDHFAYLNDVVEKFAKIVELDPWLLSCIFGLAEISDLTHSDDLQALAKQVGSVIDKVQEKYRSYRIDEPPYVFVKNNAGTYGMGMMDVQSSDEILQMNRRVRNKLLSAKGGKKTESFLIQEGIPTADFYSGQPIEPVIYMVGWDVVGGFFRMNPERDALSSLNTPGMVFSCLCLHKLDEPHESGFLNCAEKENLVRLSTVMARLACLAAAREIKALAG